MPAETHVERGPLDPSAVAALARDRLAEIVGIDGERLEGHLHLRRDLEVDDLALIDWADLLEQELGERTVGFQLDDEDLAELETVDDAVRLVVGVACSGLDDRDQR